MQRPPVFLPRAPRAPNTARSKELMAAHPLGDPAAAAQCSDLPRQEHWRSLHCAAAAGSPRGCAAISSFERAVLGARGALGKNTGGRCTARPRQDPPGGALPSVLLSALCWGPGAPSARTLEVAALRGRGRIPQGVRCHQFF